jgi:hypothetical protein
VEARQDLRQRERDDRRVRQDDPDGESEQRGGGVRFRRRTLVCGREWRDRRSLVRGSLRKESRSEESKRATLSYWVWIFVGVGSFLLLSLLVGLALAAVLANIGRSASDLYETEEWALTPLSRSLRDAEPEDAKQPQRVVRLR